MLISKWSAELGQYVILPAYAYNFIPANTFYTEYPQFHTIPSA